MLIEPSPSPPFKAEREGPAKREGEVGGAANRINRPLHPALPPAATGRRGERVIRSDDWHIFSASAVMTAGVGFAVLAGFGRLATDELVKIAALAARGFLLIKQRQVRLVKLLEEFVQVISSRLSSFAFGALGNSMRIIPVPSFDCVEWTAAGRPLRASTHLRISSWSVVTWAMSFSSVEASPLLMPTAGLSLETGGGRGRVQLTSLGLGL